LDFLKDLDERALKYMKKDNDLKVKNHLVGLEMIRDNLWNKLKNEGVREVKVEEKKDV
jgi:molecular chaperone GrpE (heat shock protein)